MLRKLILTLGLLAFVGCGENASTIGNPADSQTVPSEPVAVATVVTPAEFAQELAARQGKVVLVEMWATW